MPALAQTAPHVASKPRTFTNPVLPNGADPWVIKQGRSYYYCGVRGGKLTVGKTSELLKIGENIKEVYAPPRNSHFSKNVWAPELHYFDGRWYIYFAADDGKNENHRMYVVRSKTSDAQGEYEMMGQLDTGGRWAIDGTVFKWRGKLYMVWSGWEGTNNVAQNLYIAPMSDPWTISGKRVLISKPELPWETRDRPLINEGPTAIKNAGRLFVIYSASGSWGDNYCLGRLNFTGGNILDPKNWTKHPDAVFSRTDKVWGPGHASFVKGYGRDWIVYHSAKHSGAGWNRLVRIQPFTWDKDGAPVFGKPIDPGVPIEY